eukprot:CAMPEP_0183716170 /NCGR_PEP_ID=MMETSP0737-20130205/10167_1 /TAXON_ID=385413 /ORGANISM="Thalassiosira miniscula, Strain CCMP1093" /LENGTH=369 /DNA_ID=CAMNT_0025945393 /DNA_START=135 /DNA_END=1244 /DNA_ORIENTATION=+
MPTIHYTSRTFLRKQGVRCPPRTPDQIVSRLRRARESKAKSIKEPSASLTNNDEPSARAAGGNEHGFDRNSDGHHYCDVISTNGDSRGDKKSPVSPLSVMDVRTEYRVADDSSTNFAGARKRESSRGITSSGSPTGPSSTSTSKSPKKRTHSVESESKSVNSTVNFHCNHKDDKDDSGNHKKQHRCSIGDALKSAEYRVNQKIFARDRGVLYEAKVMKCQYDEQNQVWKYHVHYLGFAKSHERWLTPNDVMKRTPSNRKYYRESRALIKEKKKDGKNNSAQSATKTKRGRPKVEEYHESEKIYAWDRGVLYEAIVMSCQQHGQKRGWTYHVHYFGYSKSHDRWLSPKDMMKTNASNRKVYCQLRGLSFK